MYIVTDMCVYMCVCGFMYMVCVCTYIGMNVLGEMCVFVCLCVCVCVSMCVCVHICVYKSAKICTCK